MSKPKDGEPNGIDTELQAWRAEDSAPYLGKPDRMNAELRTRKGRTGKLRAKSGANALKEAA
jgi:hypothetical protein